MLELLDRMRLERRLTVIFLAVLMVVAFLYNLFFAYTVASQENFPAEQSVMTEELDP